MTTRSDVRKAFKAIGYRVSFKRNPFKDTLCTIAFQSPDMLKPCEVSSCAVYSTEFSLQHDAAFTLTNHFRGQFLDDTEQKIV